MIWVQEGFREPNEDMSTLVSFALVAPHKISLISGAVLSGFGIALLMIGVYMNRRTRAPKN